MTRLPGAVRVILLVSFGFTAVELLLLGHYESALQWIPLVAIGASLGAFLWRRLDPAPRSLTAIKLVMSASVVSGLLGVILHYRGNVEFELERVPELAGWALFRQATTGATPLLAPGVLIQLGVLGWLVALSDHREI